MVSEANEAARQLTRSTLQAMGLLGMYRAELARVLGGHCADVGRLASGQTFLQPGSRAWQAAERFVAFYRLLDSKMQHDEVKVYHWLRANNRDLHGTPLLLIVDDGRLLEVTRYLENEYK